MLNMLNMCGEENQERPGNVKYVKYVESGRTIPHFTKETDADRFSQV